jgi:hypothetical protein
MPFSASDGEKVSGGRMRCVPLGTLNSELGTAQEREVSKFVPARTGDHARHEPFSTNLPLRLDRGEGEVSIRSPAR